MKQTSRRKLKVWAVGRQEETSFTFRVVEQQLIVSPQERKARCTAVLPGVTSIYRAERPDSDMLARSDCLSQSSELLLFTINTAFQNKSIAPLSCLLNTSPRKIKLKHISTYMHTKVLSAVMCGRQLSWFSFGWVFFFLNLKYTKTTKDQTWRYFQRKKHVIYKSCLVITTQTKKNEMLLLNWKTNSKWGFLEQSDKNLLSHFLPHDCYSLISTTISLLYFFFFFPQASICLEPLFSGWGIYKKEQLSEEFSQFQMTPKLIVSIVRQHLKLPFVEIKSTAAELRVLRHLIWATVTIIYMLSIRNNNGFLWHVIGLADQFEDWEEQPYQSVCGHSQHGSGFPRCSLSQWEKPPFFCDEIIALFWGIHRFYFCV